MNMSSFFVVCCYEITLSLPTQGPTGVIPAGTRVRRTSSDRAPRSEERSALLAYLRKL